MENGATTSTITIKGILSLLMESISEEEGEKRVISLGMGDPTLYSCFRTTQVSLQAVSDSLLSNKFNGYAPTVGLPQARRLVLSYHLSLFVFLIRVVVLLGMSNSVRLTKPSSKLNQKQLIGILNRILILADVMNLQFLLHSRKAD